MKRLQEDIVLDQDAFSTASESMQALKTRTEDLKTQMEQMYEDLKKALDTPSGEAVELVSKNVLLKPIEDMLLVIGHVSSTLSDINGSGYYKDVFIKYENLNSKINFNK